MMMCAHKAGSHGILTVHAPLAGLLRGTTRPFDGIVECRYVPGRLTRCIGLRCEAPPLQLKLVRVGRRQLLSRRGPFQG